MPAHDLDLCYFWLLIMFTSITASSASNLPSLLSSPSDCSAEPSFHVR